MTLLRSAAEPFRLEAGVFRKQAALPFRQSNDKKLNN
jgi:hypothetical protein